jgi:hypothetical protein
MFTQQVPLRGVESFAPVSAEGTIYCTLQHVQSEEQLRLGHVRDLGV